MLLVFACLCVCVLCVVCFCVVVLLLLLCAVCVVVCSGPLRRTPLRRTPLRRTPLRQTPLRRTALRRTAQNFALFFPSPATVFILFSLSCWSFSLNFGGVFEDRDPQMCTFGLSGCRVKPRRPHQTGPGLAHDSLRTPVQGTCASKHHQNSTRRPPERDEKNEFCSGRGKKKREILGPHPSGPHPSGPQPFGDMSEP